MEGIKKPPRRVQLLFNHFVTTKEQKLKGAHRIMVLIHANKNTVSEFFQDICDHLGLRCTSSHGPILKLKETIIPGFQPTSIFRDLDKIIVEGDFIKKRKKKAVATEKKIKEVRKRPLPEETGLKREQKEVEIPTSPKKACPGNGTQQSLPSHLIPGQPRFMSPDVTNSNSNSAWEANGEATNGKASNNVHKACPGNDTQQSLPSHLIPGQPRFMSPDVTNSNSNSAWEANGKAANVNESTPPQQNGWDAWEPKH